MANGSLEKFNRLDDSVQRRSIEVVFIKKSMKNKNDVISFRVGTNKEKRLFSIKVWT